MSRRASGAVSGWVGPTEAAVVVVLSPPLVWVDLVWLAGALDVPLWEFLWGGQGKEAAEEEKPRVGAPVSTSV